MRSKRYFVNANWQYLTQALIPGSPMRYNCADLGSERLRKTSKPLQKASAVHYSLIETAKANGIEPFAYSKALLARMPYAETV